MSRADGPAGRFGIGGMRLLVALTAGVLAACSSGPIPTEPVAVRALVVAADRGSGEPRHVADALMQYRLLLSRGLTDDEIALVLPAWAAGGPGGAPAVRAAIGGPDLRSGATVDLVVSELDPDRIVRHLEAGGDALQAYVFLSGHGDRTGMRLTDTQPVLDGGHLATALEALQDGRSGKVTLTAVIEGCEPDSFLDALGDRPGAAVLTAAARGRSSFATEYDPQARTWLADEFTSALSHILAADPPASASGLLEVLSDRVRDSEPQLSAPPELTVDELVPGRSPTRSPRPSPAA